MEYNLENNIRNLEIKTEEAEAEKENLRLRESTLSVQIEKLEQDVEILNLMEKNQKKLKEDKEAYQKKVIDMQTSLGKLRTELESELNTIASDKNVLETLNSIGEDTSEADKYLNEKESLIKEAFLQVESIAERIEIMPSQLGKTITGGSNKRLDKISVDMSYRDDKEYTPEEFIEQAQEQEDGLNHLTIKEFMEDYQNRKENGRNALGTKAQKQYVDGIKVSRIDELMQEGQSFEEARKEVLLEISDKDALHNPDQIAGGKASIISSLGTSSANKSLGSLWNHGRAEQLYEKITELSRNMTEEEKARTYLNVQINYHL